MATSKQQLGDRGEKAVCKRAACPECGRVGQLRQLKNNFECVDVICKFCGCLGQVKSVRLKAGSDQFPPAILGAAWGPQSERINAEVFHGLYLVGYRPNGKTLVRIDYVPPAILSANREVFQPRKPLGPKAKRSGWQGFNLHLAGIPGGAMTRIFP